MGALCCCLKSKPQDADTEVKQKSSAATTTQRHARRRHGRPVALRQPHSPASFLSLCCLHLCVCLSCSASNHVGLSNTKAATVVVTAPDAVSGVGTVLGNSQLLQNRAYFEVHITALPAGASFCCGLTGNAKDELAAPLSSRPASYCLSSTSPLVFPPLQAGDVVGVWYDLSGVKPVLSFSVNGVRQAAWSVAGVKGDVWPAVSVMDGAALRVVFVSAHMKYADEPLRQSGYESPIRVRSVM